MSNGPYPPVNVEYRGGSSYQRRRDVLMRDYGIKPRRILEELEEMRPDVARDLTTLLCDLMHHRAAETRSE